MTKYNAGDILEILEDFTQLGARYKSGDKYKVAAITSSGYNLEPLQAGSSWSAQQAVFDPLEIVRKVEPFLQHMELGKTYQSKGNYFFYTPTEFDFEAGLVEFDFVSDVGDFASTSHRHFYLIEEEFGVLPPDKPVGVSQVTLDELKDENTIAAVITEPETVSVDALREAYAYVDPEYLDLDKLIALAKRLS